MAAGNAVARANSILNVYRNTAYAAIANVYVQIHTGDPGAAGTANVSANTDRPEVTWNAPSTGSMTKLNTPSWLGWSAGPETLTHISLWTAATGGSFLESFQATTPVSVVNGNDVTLNTLTLSVTPIAS